jgi:hypothetical protein
MAVVAGLVFFAFRALFALMPAFSSRHPIKKWAVAVVRRAGGLYGEKLRKFLVSATFRCGLTTRRAAASVEAW